MKRSSQSPSPHAVVRDRLLLSREGVMWLAVSLFVGFLGWWRSINVVFLLADFMICVLLFNGLLSFVNVRRVSVQRESLTPLHAGEETIIRLNVDNTSRRSSTVIVDEQIAGAAAGWLIPDLAGKSSVSCYARRTFGGRGRFPAQVRISSGYPIGLVSVVRHEHMTEVTVLPALGVVDPDGMRRWFHRQVGSSDHTRKVLRMAATDQADVRGVRPYRPGDQIRTVHWKSSAHRGELVVREYDTSPTPELVLVVEPWLPDNPTEQERNALEAALSLAATITTQWIRIYGTRVTLAVAGDPDSLRITSPSDRGIREALVPLSLAEGNTEFLALNRDRFDHSFGRAARLIVSSRSQSPYAAQMTSRTGRLFVAVSPHDRLPWYQPPAGSEQGSRASVITAT